MCRTPPPRPAMSLAPFELQLGTPYQRWPGRVVGSRPGFRCSLHQSFTQHLTPRSERPMLLT